MSNKLFNTDTHSGKRFSLKKFALVASICILVVWGVLGTGTSLAWFTDTDEELNNVFHFADFDLVVSHRLEDGSYEEITAETKVFDDKALYEPGYVQVVYLKIENKGDVPFDFETAVRVTSFTVATNRFGQPFLLQDYLKFGLVCCDTEAEMDAAVADRSLASDIADMPLNNYDSDIAELEAGGDAYVAIVVRMPEDVSDKANYRGDVIPEVQLGLIVNATQKKEP